MVEEEEDDHSDMFLDLTQMRFLLLGGIRSWMDGEGGKEGSEIVVMVRAQRERMLTTPIPRGSPLGSQGPDSACWYIAVAQMNEWISQPTNICSNTPKL